MSLLARLTETIAAKVNALLDHFDEPGEALDYAYQLELEQLLRVRRAVMDVASAEQRLRVGADRLRRAASDLESRGRQELSMGRHDKASEALARRAVLLEGAASFVAQAEEIAEEEHRFAGASARLGDKVDVLAARKGAMKAQYATTGSRDEIDHVVADLHEETEKIETAVRRAKERVGAANQRAAATDDLLASAALYDLEQAPSAIETELEAVRGSEEIERDLAWLRRSS